MSLARSLRVNRGGVGLSLDKQQAQKAKTTPPSNLCPSRSTCSGEGCPAAGSAIRLVLLPFGPGPSSVAGLHALSSAAGGGGSHSREDEPLFAHAEGPGLRRAHRRCVLGWFLLAALMVQSDQFWAGCFGAHEESRGSCWRVSFSRRYRCCPRATRGQEATAWWWRQAAQRPSRQGRSLAPDSEQAGPSGAYDYSHPTGNALPPGPLISSTMSRG